MSVDDARVAITTGEADGHVPGLEDGGTGNGVEAGRQSGSTLAGYDMRKAASGYAAIVGTAGGFVVTAVVLVFTIAGKQSVRHPVELGLTTGLLVLGLVGCLAGAFALAAIGGERHLTANLPPAGMYIGAGVVVALVAILAAFEVLAAIYLPDSKILFAGIAAGTGAAGVVFNALAVADAWPLGPDDELWRKAQWLQSRRQAIKWTRVLWAGSFAVVAGGFTAHLLGVRPVGSTGAANILVAIGIVIVLISVLAGVFRTALGDDGVETGMRLREALASQAVASVYVAVLLAALP